MTNAEKVIKNKMGLIKLAEQLGNVSQACKIMGYSPGNREAANTSEAHCW